MGRMGGHMKNYPEYKLVYQGGHHSVFCNRENHIRVAGGKSFLQNHNNPRWNKLQPFSCDCYKWKQDGE